MVRVTEAAAVAASKWIGRGDNDAADAAAVEAMREALNELPFDGTVVIGEGERDEAPMLYIGEKVGSAQGTGPKINIALDPLEGTTLTAKAGPNALCVLTISEEGGLLNAPDTYMDKLAIGPGYPEGTIDLSQERHRKHPRDRRREGRGSRTRSSPASSTGRGTTQIIDELRSLGCGVKLISDGDVAGVIAVTDPDTEHRRLSGQRRRAGRRPGRIRAALRRRPDAGPPRLPQRRRDRARPPLGHRGPRSHLQPRGNGEERLHLRRDRRDRRLAAPGRSPAQELHHHRKHRDARKLGHGPARLAPSTTSGTTETPRPVLEQPLQRLGIFDEILDAPDPAAAAEARACW